MRLSQIFMMKITHNAFCGRGFNFPLGQKTYIMGILNVTPDSFSDGGCYYSVEAAVRRARQIEAEGADLIDIGAVSTRPDCEQVSEAEEQRRLMPVISILTGELNIPISVDTFNPSTAEAVLKEGVAIINDVSGRPSKEMAELIKKYNAGWIIMHTEAQAQAIINYPNGVVRAVADFFDATIEKCRGWGISDNQLCLDPGFGFAKDVEQNYELLRAGAELKREGIAYLTALSRKRFTGYAAGIAKERDRDNATIAADTLAIYLGSDMLRVHNVSAAVEAARFTDAAVRP